MSKGHLQGKTIVITRPKRQAQDMARLLCQAGARVLICPLIKIEPPRSWRSLDDALRQISRYNIVVFTSVNGVQGFFKRARALKLKNLPRPQSLYAIGPGTAAALAEHGWTNAQTPRERRGEGLADALGTVLGKRILIARAAVAREVLPDLLRKRGALVRVAEVYRTLPDLTGVQRLRKAKRIDVVAFTSASAVDQFAQHIGVRFLATTAVASIGPITSAALRAHGIKATVVARTASIPALCAALQSYFAKGA